MNELTINQTNFRPYTQEEFNKIKTADDFLKYCNNMALWLYANVMGYDSPLSIRMWESYHGHKVSCWNAAVTLIEEVYQTDYTWIYEAEVFNDE